MFEKEIKFIGDFCFNQVTKLGSHFTLDKVIEAGVHPAVVQYISAELDFMIFSDRRKLLQQSYFDYTGKEIAEQFKKISGEIKKNKKISQEDAKKLIFQAVSFNVNYLVRPRWSLVKLIFNDQPLVPVEEMKMMLNYLYYYDYFRNVLSGYLAKRKIFQISSSEFDIILNKIDKELTDSNRKLVIENAFKSMGDFFNIGGVDKNLVLLTGVEIFFKEKSMLELLLKLRKSIPNGGKKQYDRNELERIMFSPKQKAEPAASIETEEEKEVIDEKEEINSEIEQEITETEQDEEIPKAESFLTPEEEQALLSLYNDEPSESIETEIEEEQLVSDELTEMKEQIEEEKDLSQGEETIPELDSEIVDDTEKTIYEITEDLTYKESETDETPAEETLDSEKIEITDQVEEESDLFEPGFEKEIVQEMIKDFTGEGEHDSEIEEVNEEDEIKEEEKVEEIKEEIPEPTLEDESKSKIESLEDELLNIFEGLDEEDYTPSEEKTTEEAIDPISSETENVIEEEQPEEIAEPDSMDDFIKNINDAVFTEEKEETKETKEEVKKENKEEIKPEKAEEKPVKNIEPPVKEEPATKQKPNTKEELPKKEESSKNIFDKPILKPREFRRKDIFSYLRRKDIKKIVLLIFANDEEDFVNTAERIMDCENYKEASEILKAVFTSYKISPYSKEAITFTNAVSNYFRQA